MMKVERRRAVEEQFDRVSQNYLSERSSPENIREKERIINLVQSNSKYQNVLDIGCGPGTITEDLLEISEKVWGIDISEDMIKIAIERFKDNRFKNKINFEVGDAENLRFSDEFFDVIYCIGVLRYANSWEKTIQEIYRLLKPDGVVVLTFYYRFSPHWFSMYFLYRPLLPFISFVKRRSLRDCYLKYKAEPLPFSYRKFKRIFTESGFRKMEIQHSGFTVFPFNRLFPKLSTYVYLMMESALFNSTKLGWLGSICIVKGIKQNNLL